MSRYGLSLIRVTSSLDGCVVAVFFLCCWCSLVGEVVRRSQLWCTRRKESFWPLIRNSFPNLHSTLILQHGVRTQKTPLISQEPTAASKQPRPLRPLLPLPLPSSSQALNFGNGHGHKMEEIGLKSTHKIRAVLVTLFYLQTSQKNWNDFFVKSVLAEKFDFFFILCSSTFKYLLRLCILESIYGQFQQYFELEIISLFF